MFSAAMAQAKIDLASWNEEIAALEAEAAAAREMAKSFENRAAVADLENYAAELGSCAEDLRKMRKIPANPPHIRCRSELAAA